MDIRLCISCRFVFEDPQHLKIRDESRPLYERRDYFASDVHHTSAQSFRDAVDAQCPICVTMLSICAPKSGPPAQSDTGEYTTYRIDYSCGDPSRSPRLLPKIWVHFYVGKGPGGRSLYLVNLHRDDTGILAAPTATSELGQIKTGVQECVSSHMTCNTPTAGQFRYPTRLIEVNAPGNPQVRLIETANTNGIKGPYNVLSYRWGAFQPIKLLQGNITQFRNGIPLSSLPRTLSDAIEITRTMGFPFLWIDALCIIQDSPSDWASEARAMASVYGNAHCSLAASHNTDSNGGLAPSIPGSSRGQPISIRFPTSPDWDVPYCDLQLIEHNFWANRVEDAPLNTRGWVVQERILAPRTVHFTFDQALFECREMRRSQTRMDLTANRISSPQVTLPISGQRITASGFAKYWASAVAYYTTRQLTFASDRPVAIAGIARALQTTVNSKTKTRIKRKTKYIAGLWSTGLLRWLLWETVNAEYPRTYRAPSWSWLALAGGDIVWDSEVVQGWRYLKTDVHAEVEAWHVVTEDGTAFGVVKAGILRLRVVLIPIQMRKQGKDYVGEMMGEGEGPGKGLREWMAGGEFSWAWDESVETLDRGNRRGEVFIMPVMEVTPTKGSDDACLYGLTIERIDMSGKNVYRRTGKLTVFGKPRAVVDKEEVRDSEKETVWLV